MAYRFCHSLFKTLGQMLLSQSCALCEKQANDMVCHHCMETLDRFFIDRRYCCPQCSIPNMQGFRCGHCIERKPAFDHTVACYTYDEAIRLVINRYKFQGKLWLVRWIGDQMVKAIDQSSRPLPDLILPVPLHDNRLRSRGYNQAYEIARYLGKQLDCPFSKEGLARIKDIVPQRSLSKSARFENPKGAFVCTAPVEGKHMAVIDDVMTTGATLSEVAHVLKQHGAASVTNWVFARTLD